MTKITLEPWDSLIVEYKGMELKLVATKPFLDEQYPTINLEGRDDTNGRIRVKQHTVMSEEGEVEKWWEIWKE